MARPWLVLGGLARPFAGLASGRLRDARHEARKFQLLEDAQHVLALEAAERRGFHGELGRRVRDDGHKVLALDQHLAVLGYQPLDARRRDLIAALEKLFDGVELEDQLHRGLQADAGHTGHVVRRVAGECLDVPPLNRLEPAVALAHRVLVVQLGVAEAGREQHARVGRDELKRVGVAGHDDGIDACVGVLLGDSAEDVVGLVAGQLVDGHIERLHHLLHPAQVLDQLPWRGRAVGLVLRVLLVTERRAWRVEDDGDVGRLAVHKGLKERSGEGVDTAHVLACLPHRHGSRLLQSEPGAVYHRVAVHDQQQRLRCSGGAPRGTRAWGRLRGPRFGCRRLFGRGSVEQARCALIAGLAASHGCAACYCPL